MIAGEKQTFKKKVKKKKKNDPHLLQAQLGCPAPKVIQHRRPTRQSGKSVYIKYETIRKWRG